MSLSAAPSKGTRKSTVLPLVLLILTGFICMFNEAQMNVALPTAADLFGVDMGTAQWLTTAYMLVAGVFMPIAAFAMRRFPLRKIICFALVALIAGLVVSAYAPTFAVLLAGRMIQALGVAFYVPVMMTAVITLAPKNKFGLYNGLTLLVLMAAPAVSPTLAGLILSHLGLSWLFIVLVPVLAVLLVAMLFLLDDILQTGPARLDAPSVALSFVGFGGVVFGVGNAASAGFANPVTIVALLVGLAALIIYGKRQLSIKNPLLDLHVFKRRPYRSSVAVIVVMQFLMFGTILASPLFLQREWGLTAFEAGLVTLPAGAVNAVASLLAGMAYDRFKLKPVYAGVVVAAVGFVGVVVSLTAGWGVAGFVVASMVYALGVPFATTAATSYGLNSLAASEYPHGSSINSTIQQIAGSLGTAVFTMVLYGFPQLPWNRGASVMQNGTEAVFIVAAVLIVLLFFALFFLFKKGVEPEVVAAPAAHAAPACAMDVMKADAYRVRDTATVADAVRELVARKTSGLPVVDAAGSVVGFISDGDILKSLGGNDERATVVNLSYFAAVYQTGEGFDERAAEVMARGVMELATRNVVSVREGTSLEKVCEILGAKRIKKVPVLRGDKLVGTVSRSDVVRRLMGDLAAQPE